MTNKTEGFLYVFAFLAFLPQVFAAKPMSAGAPASGIYAIPLQTIDSKKSDLSTLKGKVLLVVNTASQCGYTPQYKGLEETYQKYKAQGLEVVGFPSNDFGGQEPGSNGDIKKFCELKYKTTFAMFEKNPVTGDQKQPLYRWINSQRGFESEVSWNFEKFLINRQGQVVQRFASRVKPTDSELTQAIEAELKKI